MSYRVRNDLEVFPMEGESQAAWVVRDPLSGNCYRLGMQEYHLFCDLQSGHPWKVIQERFHRRFPHQILTLDEFQRSVATWIRHRLILISTPQSAGQFTSGINRLGRFNPLFMRIPCWNPAERFQKCLPYLKWLYSRPIQLVTMLILLIAGLQVIAFLPVLQAEIRELPLRLGPATWWQVALLLMGFKVLHEIGHGLTCHHYGGRCREAGVMLLAFFPCLYCNVTDAWTFPRRSQRMHVTAAGILVDLLGAAVAFLLWTICAPGYLRDLLLLIALSGSLNSLLLNGNPLMRYDGYYLLSDWSGVPNLRAAAFTQVRQLLWRALFGRAKDGVPSPLSIPLLTYGVMSTVYLVLVISLILFALYHFLIPHQLDLLFLIIASLTILQMGMGIVLILAREGAQEMALRTGNPIRKRLLPGLVLLGLAGAMFIPLPHSISATAILRPSVSQAFIAPGSGMAYFEPGEAQKFQAGQILLQIQSPELDALLLQLETELARLQAKAAALERVKGLYPDAIATLGVLQEMIAEVIQQKEDASSRKQELILTAQQNGSLLRT
ncbi:MAG: hypothetical protein KDA78_10950, partial [Planctomycetaceae bacterium]|nr:hypothetical protein [Planctomycetaceae bacterium]